MINWCVYKGEYLLSLPEKVLLANSFSESNKFPSLVLQKFSTQKTIKHEKCLLTCAKLMKLTEAFRKADQLEYRSVNWGSLAVSMPPEIKKSKVSTTEEIWNVES